mmetsp:Transcript_14243/g.22251  ORF Transcript_14243/g.22251 Transcript_14243/m.22251 type:complete len:406 (+) Transcript_14243:94-1311(+)|eukprot:CAMPEP_0195307646 /NCGR_PEP_ID=MMETSP0707-20130614/37822_1 /TAXON_ID=33640 /ORGANISM="Asterionellopsis glacialis, Strain CCMP134" /LENGTH=405 /DNA_ID=CAMNT_0040371899 /DNA_START=1084 /DNA_END=2301 /DNA_ORIENTATION=+
MSDRNPCPYWRVWQTADDLEQNGLSSDPQLSKDCQGLTERVVQILRQWGNQWAGQNELQSLLNKSSLQHEVEESIVSTHKLMKWLDQRQQQTVISANEDGKSQTEPVTVVDVCCGKGLFSMLLSYIMAGDNRVKKIVMLDKAKINWHHITFANETSKTDQRPYIETWEQCNLHNHDELLDRFESLGSPLALVGIHLCKNLSPACVGLVNGLGSDLCPFLCLAPCCLPSAALSKSRKNNPNKGIIQVPQYETIEERQSRREAMKLRDGALGRTTNRPCMICQSNDHRTNDCPLLPSDKDERVKVLQKAQLRVPCWKCGVVGHFKDKCPSTQTSRRPTRITPPLYCLDVSSVLETPGPFDTYCHILRESMQRPNVQLIDTGLTNDNAQHQEGNWNSCRKSIYIVATQ